MATNMDWTAGSRPWLRHQLFTSHLRGVGFPETHLSRKLPGTINARQVP